MTKEELKLHIENRYSVCSKRTQGLSYGSFYDGYMDCYSDLENKLANADYQLEGREVELKELNKKLSHAEAYYDKMFWQKNEIIYNLQAQIEQLTYLHNEDVNTIKLLNKQIKEIKEK